MQLERITSNPKRMNGQPCIRNLRLTVRRVIELLATYPDREELYQEFPELEDEDIRQALILFLPIWMIASLSYPIAMKLLLDQGLPLSAAALLRDVGIDAIHVGEIGMAEAEDVDIIQKARGEERVVATLDADFHALPAIDDAIFPSVIHIRIERLRAHALADMLLTIITECAEELDNLSGIIRQT